MKQLSDCCKAEIKLTGSPEHKDAFACAKCGRIIGTPIKKQKPKELEWEKDFDKRWTRKSKGLKDKGKYRDDWFVIHETISREVKQFINETLTQQRTDLENQKVKVVWNDVCEQIKQETRTELLEEIRKLKMEETFSSDDEGELISEGYNNAVDEINEKITNLLNKKDETK